MSSDARPQYRRICAAVMSALVTVVAVLGSTGILPVSDSPEPAYAAAPTRSWVVTSIPRHAEPRHAAPPRAPDQEPAEATLPRRSGEGRRVVFDISEQRVWLVAGKRDHVERSYLVSGSLTDNLGPGTYEVFSTSRHAIGVDDSGTMEYMVRFTHGDHAAIGFHDIPVKDGKPVQSAAELGTPQSHGCIRQLRRDAVALWRFAPVGAKVVVTA